MSRTLTVLTISLFLAFGVGCGKKNKSSDSPVTSSISTNLMAPLGKIQTEFELATRWIELKGQLRNYEIAINGEFANIEEANKFKKEELTKLIMVAKELEADTIKSGFSKVEIERYEGDNLVHVDFELSELQSMIKDFERKLLNL